MIPFKDGPSCYINTSTKSSWITWRTVWSSCTSLVTFSSKQLCNQARQSTGTRNIRTWMKQDSRKDPKCCYVGKSALSTQPVSANGLTAASALLAVMSCYSIAALRRKSSIYYSWEKKQPKIDWNYPSPLNHLYLHRHTPLELLKIAAHRNLIST